MRIGIGRDEIGWDARFLAACDGIASRGPDDLDVTLLDLDGTDWIAKCKSLDVLVWKPAFMGPIAASLLKEKIYFAEHYLRIVVVPGFDTIWHFESKVAQSYAFELLKVPTPDTHATFSMSASVRELRDSRFPLVFKTPHGASSSQVRLVGSPREAMRKLKRSFSGELWRASRRKVRGGPFAAFLSAALSGWVWTYAARRILAGELFGVAYWQEFVPHNTRDLRVTCIGDSCAFAFWRENRPGDFRASGSGLIDYETPAPTEAVLACLALSRRMNFDSMAYDILFDGPEMVITEMSYAYVDSAVHDCPGHYVLRPSGTLEYVSGQTWPQEHWIRWAIEKAQRTQA